jgi:cobalamin-dependent methionine synthase I
MTNKGKTMKILNLPLKWGGLKQIKWQKSSRNEVFKIIRFRTLNHYSSNFVNVGSELMLLGLGNFVLLKKKNMLKLLLQRDQVEVAQIIDINMDEGCWMVFMP